MLVHHIFLVTLLALFVQFAQAQPTTCTFSCPDTNVAGQALLSRILAAPNESNYSIFECVYGEVNENPRTQSCFYYKVDGKHALGSQNDRCPESAIPCSDDGATHRFSSPGPPEVPPWIENGRYLLSLKGIIIEG